MAVRRPGGEVVLPPFTVSHSAEELDGLVRTLHGISGNIRIVMEHTGMYWRPIALALKDAGFFVSVVNAILIHDFSDNSLRKVKTDNGIYIYFRRFYQYILNVDERKTQIVLNLPALSLYI